MSIKKQLFIAFTIVALLMTLLEALLMFSGRKSKALFQEYNTTYLNLKTISFHLKMDTYLLASKYELLSTGKAPNPIATIDETEQIQNRLNGYSIDLLNVLREMEGKHKGMLAKIRYGASAVLDTVDYLQAVGLEMTVAFLDNKPEDAVKIVLEIEQLRELLEEDFDKLYGDINAVLNQTTRSLETFFTIVEGLTYLSLFICLFVGVVLSFMYKEINKKEGQLKQLVDRLDKEKKSIANLLNNMKQAVFSINSEGIIVPPVSAHTNILFNDFVEGKNVFDLVYNDIVPSSEEFSLLETAMTTTFDADEVQWILMEEYFPKKLTLKIENKKSRQHEKYLKISYHPLWNKNKLLERIMYVIDDVTAVESLERDSQKQKKISEQNVRILQRMSKINTPKLVDFFNSTNEILSNIKQVAANINFSVDYTSILRDLHTLKGNSRFYEFMDISKATHQAETTMIEIEKNNTESDKHDSLLHMIVKVEKSVSPYAYLAKKVLRINNDLQENLLRKMLDNLFQMDVNYSDFKSFQLSEFAVNLNLFSDMTQALNEQSLLKAQEELIVKFGQFEFEELEAPLEKLKTETKMIFIDSLNFQTQLLKAKTWADCASHIWDITEFYERLAKRTHHESVMEKFRIKSKELKKIFEKNNFIFLAYVFDDFTRDLNNLNAEQQSEQIEKTLSLVWKYLFLVMSVDYNQTFFREEQKSIFDKVTSEEYAEFGNNQFLFALFLKNMKDINFSLKEISQRLAPYLDCQDGKQVLSSLLLPAAPINLNETALILCEPRKTKDILKTMGEKSQNMMNRFTQSVCSDFSSLAYVVNIDLCQLILFYKKAKDKKAKVEIESVEIPNLNFRELEKSVQQLKQEKNKSDLDREIIKNFGRLFYIPMKYSFYEFAPMIQALAKEFCKDVRYNIEGDEVMVSRECYSLLQAAIIQLIRNALDHGLESPDERARRRKPIQGTLVVKCKTNSNAQIELKVTDDGRGMDSERIFKRALDHHLVKPNQQEMSQKEILQLIFLPGFSTKDNTTDFSGRGEGMDIVKTNIEKIGGSVQVISKQGEGTEFKLTFPGH